MFLKLAFYSLVIIHTAIVFANLTALFVIPFLEPWYVSIPIMSFLINLIFSPGTCPLTRLESVIRRKLGMPEIKQFGGHYFVKPVRKRFRKMRTL